MEFSLLDYDASIRNFELVGLVLLIGLWEAFGVSRPGATSAYLRWFNHFTLLVLNNVLTRFLSPAIAVSLAIAVSDVGWGLSNVVQLPLAVVFLLTIVLLDLNNYLQHWLMHRFHFLWRFHKVHHCDIDVDWSTAFRFHPGEAVFTLGLQGLVILALGAPPVAVACYEIVFILSAFFVHANVVLPAGLDSWLRLGLVTPNMHRIHHSSDRREANTNFGGIFSWWDRCLATFEAQPRAGQLGMTLGLPQYRDGEEQNLLWLLCLPFARIKAGPRPLNEIRTD